MKTNQIITLLLTSFLIMIGCTKEQESQKELPVIRLLSEKEMIIPDAGGTFHIKYEIENPAADLFTATAETSVEWIRNIAEAEGSIDFTVDENTEEKVREGIITLNYPEAESVSIKIRQEAVREKSIEIRVVSTETTSFTVDLIPSDPEMQFISMVVLKDYFTQAGIETDDDIMEDDLSYFEYLAEQQGISVEDVIREFIQEGEVKGLAINGLAPETEYIMYAYGFDLETMDKTTAVTRCPVSTESVPQEEVEFDIDYNINGQTGKFNITPGNAYDGWWYFQVVPVPIDPETGEPMDMSGYDWEAELHDFMLLFVGQFTNMGYTVEEVLNTFFFQGEKKLQAEMPTDNEYYAIAVGVNEEGFKCTPVSKVNFRSGNEVVPSENVITMEFSSITQSTAHLKTTVSVGCDTYQFRALRKRDVAEKSPDEIAQYIIDNFILDLRQGAIDEDITGLEAGTEYLGVTFGYWENVITTDILISEFKTISDAKSKVNLNIEHGSWYDINAVADLAPKYNDYRDYDAFYPLVITPDAENVKIYAAIYTDESSYMLTDADLRGFLKSEGEKKEINAFILSYDVKYRAYAYAVDSNDDYTALYRSEAFTLTRDEVSDPQEFLDLLAGGQKAAAVSRPSILIGEEAQSPILESFKRQEIIHYSIDKDYRPGMRFCIPVR